MGTEVLRGYLSVSFSLLLVASVFSLLSSDPTSSVPSMLSVRRSEFMPDSARTAPRHGDSVLYGALTDGAGYRRIRTSRGAVVHVIEIDSRRGLRLEAVKARDSYDGLETITELFQRAEREARRDGDTVLAAINGGPWYASRLSPVGPLVINGEVVELAGDDAWSSLLLYTGGSVAITRDRVAGQLFWRHRRFDILSVNRRLSDESVVLYNRMYGDFVPAVALRNDRDIVRDVLASREADDSGIDFEDEDVDSAQIVRTYRNQHARAERERSAMKIAVRRLPAARRDWFGEPRLNDTMWTVVTMIDTGTVPVPHDGYVVSLGASEELFHSARPGDTLRLLFQVARNGIGVVRDVVPGYPQLLFAGRPSSEPDFLQGPAAAVRGGERSARTAIGVSADGNVIYVVAVEAPADPGRGGMTIDELSATMQSLGAHHAVALEGRSATTMVVNYETVTHGQGAAPERPVGSGLVVKKKRTW